MTKQVQEENKAIQNRRAILFGVGISACAAACAGASIFGAAGLIGGASVGAAMAQDGHMKMEPHNNMAPNMAHDMMANPIMPFTQAAFDAAQQAGKSIIIHVHASWCPTCQAQAHVIDAILAEPANHSVLAFRVDFDNQKSAVAAFGAQSQSVIIGFHGRNETSRLVGERSHDQIEAIFTSAKSHM